MMSNLYDLPDNIRVSKSRRMRWVWHVARMGEMGNLHKILVGKPEEKRPLGRRRRRWEDDIGTDLTEIEWECVDRVYSAQNRGK
jgi:hypothetical protein